MRGNKNANHNNRPTRPGHVLWGNRAIGAILAMPPATRTEQEVSGLV